MVGGLIHFSPGTQYFANICIILCQQLQYFRVAAFFLSLKYIHLTILVSEYATEYHFQQLHIILSFFFFFLFLCRPICKVKKYLVLSGDILKCTFLKQKSFSQGAQRCNLPCNLHTTSTCIISEQVVDRLHIPLRWRGLLRQYLMCCPKDSHYYILE